MEDQLYSTLQDALKVASENTPANAELARRPGSVIVAEVSEVGDEFSLVAVTVESEATWNRNDSNRHLVKRSDASSA